MLILKTLDRRSEESFDFMIQIEKLITKKICQVRAYRGLAYTGHTNEKYPHVPTLDLVCLPPSGEAQW
jgi:hypothetical protein